MEFRRGIYFRVKKLIIRMESSDRQYPPINLVVAVEDDVARIIRATPITSTTLSIFESHFITPKAQKAEFDQFKLG